MTQEATRVRKNIWKLNGEEVKLLSKAYEGIMARDSKETYSYFNLAANHGYPNDSCRHHMQLFCSYHRAYMLAFENALRSVPGCENVTLPYFNPLDGKGFPDWCYQAPFSSYQIPEDRRNAFEKWWSKWPGNKEYKWNNGTTSRNKNEEVIKNVKDTGVPGMVKKAMKSRTWQEFSNDEKDSNHHGLEDPHDYLHYCIGGDEGWMSHPSIAAYDPVFWFHHSNIERMFTEWQESVKATTVEALNAIAGKYTIPWDDPLAVGVPVPGFPSSTSFREMVHVDYVRYDDDHGGSASNTNLLATSVRSLAEADLEPTAEEFPTVVVENIDRSKVPTSFFIMVDVHSGGQVQEIPIFIFQRGEGCENCQKKKLITVSRTSPALENFDKLEARAVSMNKKTPLDIGALNLRVIADPGKSATVESSN